MIKIIYTTFPKEIQGIFAGGVQKLEEGYLILIDSDRPKEEQDFTLRHELAHIALNHCETGSGALGEGWEQREQEADSLAGRMTVDELMNMVSESIDVLS